MSKKTTPVTNGENKTNITYKAGDKVKIVATGEVAKVVTKTKSGLYNVQTVNAVDTMQETRYHNANEIELIK